MLSQLPAGGFQGQSLVVMDKSDSVVTKTLTLPSEKENSVTQGENQHGIGLLTTLGNIHPTHKRPNNSGGYPARSTVCSCARGHDGRHSERRGEGAMDGKRRMGETKGLIRVERYVDKEWE